MKIRSKPLYTYLQNANVLDGTKEDIYRAKCEYRRMYKKNWKKIKRARKELRIEISLRQYMDIKVRASELELKHTVYARNLILAAVESKQFIPHKDRLLKIMQLVSIITIAASKNSLPLWQIGEQLVQAEKMLLEYLDS